jgi:phosphopantetheine adenylyltransferase
MTGLEFGYVSSTLAKEVATFGGDVSEMVPPGVARALGARLRGT